MNHWDRRFMELARIIAGWSKDPGTEARETRRACFDDRCQCRATCRLWTERDSPGYAIKAMTWRTHWLCFTEPCSYHQPVGAL